MRPVLRLMLTIVAALAASAAPAAGQATYAGGLLPGVTEPSYYQPTLGIALQPRGDRVALRFETSLRCPGESHEVSGRALAPFDGTAIRTSRAMVLRVPRGRVEYGWELAATVAGDAVTGVLRVAGRKRLRGGRWRSCAARPERPFEARLVAPAGAPPAPPVPRGAYYGASASRIVDRLPGPVVVRVSADGRRVAARWHTMARCTRGPRVELVNLTPATAVRPDGSFVRNERFAVRFADGLVRYRVAFAGRFLRGAVAGTLRMRARLFDRRGRKLRARCDTGVLPWSARSGTDPGEAPASGSPAAPAGEEPPPGTTTSPPPPPPPSDPDQPRRPVPGPWSVTSTSEPGDYVGQGQTYDLGAHNADTQVNGDPRMLSFATLPRPGAGDNLDGGFFAPEGQTFQPGTTYVDNSTYEQQTGSAGMAFSSGSRACNDGTGKFVIDELSFDPDGTLRTATVRFTFRCAGSSAALSGTWRFQAA